MSLGPTGEQYSMTYTRIQVLLHWFSAIIILWATLSGFYVALFDVADATRQAIGFLNVSLTFTLIPFFALRVLLALLRASAVQPTSAEGWAARLAHFAIYLTTIVVLITGVLMMDRDINVFNVLTLPPPLIDVQLTSAFNAAHKYACMVLAGLLVLHIAAVIKHHASGNPVLKRMRW